MKNLRHCIPAVALMVAGTCLEPPIPGWSRARRRDWRFPVQDSGGWRRLYLLGWQALGRKLAEEHANVFVYEPGAVVGSHNHACLEAQRRIGTRLYDHTVRMKACCRRLREDLQWLAPGYAATLFI
jgi:hypothetical protein